MAGLRLKIHPFFFVFGIYYAIIGKIFIFIIYTLTALMHELGHLFQAEKLGYAFNSVTLMPYGAVLDGSVQNLKLKDEAAFALAGPLFNLSIALFFTAIWWLFPQIYAYTETVVAANLTIGLVNLIPAYPLDGGRVLFCALSIKFGEKKAALIVKILGLIFFLALTALFIRSIFLAINLSILFFAIFILLGLFGRKKQSAYIRIFNISNARVEKGLRIKKYAVGKKTTLKKIIALIDLDCLSEIAVLDEKSSVIAVFNQKQLLKMLENGSLYDEINKFVV